MKNLLPILLIAFLTAPCLRAEPEKYVIKPEIMRLFIGGFEGPSYEVLYDGRELRYYAADNMFALRTAKPKIIKPSPEQWQAFFDELEALHVWSWKDRYEDPGTADGTVCSSIIVYPTRDRRALVSSGSNQFPDNYPDFLKTVRKLIGDLPFE